MDAIAGSVMAGGPLLAPGTIQDGDAATRPQGKGAPPLSPEVQGGTLVARNVDGQSKDVWDLKLTERWLGMPARTIESSKAVTRVSREGDGSLSVSTEFKEGASRGALNPNHANNLRRDGLGIDNGTSAEFFISRDNKTDKSFVTVRVPVGDDDGAPGNRWVEFQFETKGMVRLQADGLLRFSGKTWDANALEQLIEDKGFKLPHPFESGGME